MITDLINGINVDSILHNCLYEIHSKGPISALTFEKLAYVKKFHPDKFKSIENKLILALGLFYKTKEPKSILEEFYSIYANAINDETGSSFTATQASVYRGIKENRYFSFSAPTSSGKSYLFRELIKNTKNDILIIVPSRALIAEYYNEILDFIDKDTLVLQFIENINTLKSHRRVFIITPERGLEVLKYKNIFSIDLILLDEAQISDEEIRGMTFDALVRQLDKAFPKAKKVFAHPFVDNPAAQINKHKLNSNSDSKNYNLHTAGKIFISTKNRDDFKYFSPNIKSKHVSIGNNPVIQSILEGGTLLIYISKNKIYDGKYLLDFGDYISCCQEIADPSAISLIKNLKNFIGASDKPKNEKYSLLIDLMSKGIVIHHGSMPLKARLMVEEFIRKGYAKICFATSTLAQGINMPFDVVWIDNFNRMTPIVLKNLIGRAGRTTKAKGVFDYGYTIIKNENIDTFTTRFKEIIKLNETSRLDLDIREINIDQQDLAESIKNETFDIELHLPESQIDRIKKSTINNEIKFILDNVLKGSDIITGAQYYELPDPDRDKIKTCFKKIYSIHLKRSKLEKAEAAVLSAAIPIMLWHIQGRSFSEIVSLRYSFLSHKDQQRKIINRLKNKEINQDTANEELSNLTVRYSPIAAKIPNISLKASPLFSKSTPVTELSYDILIYDTYDYLDKVISLSMIDPITAALEIYFESTSDIRAIYLQNYITYGTNDEKEIWMIKYGFSFEDITWLKSHIIKIDSSEIIFDSSIYTLSAEQIKTISRYL